MANYRELVKSWSVDELLDKENELDAIWDLNGCDEDLYRDQMEFRLAINEELNSRGVFDARDYEEYDPWQGYEEPEDEPDVEPVWNIDFDEISDMESRLGYSLICEE